MWVAAFIDTCRQSSILSGLVWFSSWSTWKVGGSDIFFSETTLQGLTDHRLVASELKGVFKLSHFFPYLDLYPKYYLPHRIGKRKH